jgi:DNA repair exonuclease SbcCD ATPase subunit
MVKGLEDVFTTLFGNQQSGMAGVVALEMVTCIHCGTPFGIERDRHRELRRSGKDFWCPNGHVMVYRVGETQEDKLKKQLALEAKNRERLETQLKNARAETEAVERRRRATKGQVTKLRNQIANGACPCCGKIFAHLQNHMAEAHADFLTTEPEEISAEGSEG